ncbi:aldose 1-epimerase family protein [Citreicella sp. C3M06]|uniref:aldose 1-epimerase family protein n=1 Tax=Citreicella sp. C3M06 TaxID=2841564 RepID=UPI001C0A5240|nr:aldose 1-epimerase family protein [Citreicella sp. C3M06]MBU2963150.1 aldose 1-epimerase family protein [Citreicella sp. C3M06]
MTDRVRLQNDVLKVAIAAQGAELQSLQAQGRELLWQGDPAWWAATAPILFPIIGLAPDNKVAFGDDVFEMSKHGFARHSRFTAEQQTATSCRHVLRDSDATRACFPFGFELAVIHSLDGSTLKQAAEITNTDTRAMPFGFGFHPAFALPQPGGGAETIITLDNGAEPPLARLASDGLLAAERHPSPFEAGRLTITPDLFVEDALIFPEGAGTGLTWSSTSGPELRFGFENLPNLAIWQKVGAPFLCIEPWHGTAARHGGTAQMTDRPYTLTLAPGETVRFAWQVTVLG